MQESRPVLILGGGINGAAIARELLLRRIPVVLVDTQDLACGATSRSSRLIHGGLRYLEYGEFDLVRESLQERKHLLASAPHLVHPLRLHTPTPGRLGGFWQSARRFFGWAVKQPKPRGMWLVRMGLWLYQAYAADPGTRPVSTNRPGQGEALAVDPQRFRWVSCYDDGQVLWPERLTLEWLIDAQRLAKESGVEFRVLTRTKAVREGERVRLEPVAQQGDFKPPSDGPLEISPRLIINATGSWVDDALQRLKVDSKRLMGGTKGSHLFVANEKLQSALRGDGVYVEAADCRPVFILPMNEVALVGTTDLRFDGDPGAAVADQDEVDYLIDAVNGVFPNVDASRSDVVAHYAGVRPLPYVDASAPGAITRRHFLHPHEGQPPVLSIIGGKLTTCRALAEEAAQWVLKHHGEQGVEASSANRATPGGENYPEESQRRQEQQQCAERFEIGVDSVEATWRLYGVRTPDVLESIAGYGREALCPIDEAAPLPLGLARYSIENEWARSLSDIIERRMFLVHAGRLKREWLTRLAESCGGECAEDSNQQVELCEQRLVKYYGRTLED